MPYRFNDRAKLRNYFQKTKFIYGLNVNPVSFSTSGTLTAQ